MSPEPPGTMLARGAGARSRLDPSSPSCSRDLFGSLTRPGQALRARRRRERPHEGPSSRRRASTPSVVTGRPLARALATSLAESAAAFLAAYEIDRAQGTFDTVKMYFSAHFLPFFGSFDSFTEAGYCGFVRERIARTTRVTVRKEMSALRLFVGFCNHRGMKLPPVPVLPKHGHAGTRSKHARKRVAPILNPAEVAAILAAMPERSRRTGSWVRPSGRCSTSCTRRASARPRC